ncbi:sulfite exporter TauE/SafE family protein [soil metagenome]
MPDISLFFWAMAVIASVLIGLSKGGLPMIGVLGVPVLAMATSPVRAAGLLLPIYVVTDMFGLWAYRREYDSRNLKILIPAATFGVAIGWATASIVSDRFVTMLIGIIGLAFTIEYYFRGRHRLEPKPADVPRGIFWGTVSGFTSFVSHAGAPPYQMYAIPQRMEKMVFAGTSTILFAVVNAVKLVPYWALGQLSTDNLKIAALLVPAGVAATFAGVKLTRIIPQVLFYRAVLIALFLISLKLVYDAVA